MGHGDQAGLVGVEAEEVVSLVGSRVAFDVLLDRGVDGAGGHGAGGDEGAEAGPVLDVADAERGEHLRVADLICEVDWVHEVDGLDVAEPVVLDGVGERRPGRCGRG